MGGDHEDIYLRVPFTAPLGGYSSADAWSAECASEMAIPNSYGFHMQFIYAKTPLQHSRHHLIRWPVAIRKCLDVDDHFLAHFGAAFFGGRAHMRQ